MERGLPVVMLAAKYYLRPLQSDVGRQLRLSSLLREMGNVWTGRRGEVQFGVCHRCRAGDSQSPCGQMMLRSDTFNINGRRDHHLESSSLFDSTRYSAEHLSVPLNTWPLAAKARLLAPVRSAARYALTRFNRSVMKIHAQKRLGRAVHESHRIVTQTDPDPRPVEIVRGRRRIRRSTRLASASDTPRRSTSPRDSPGASRGFGSMAWCRARFASPSEPGGGRIAPRNAG